MVKLILASCALFMLLNPLGSYAVTKSQVQGIVNSAPSRNCSNFFSDPRMSSMLQSRGIDYPTCVSLLKRSTQKCMSRYGSQIPSSSEGLDEWRDNFKNCVREDFKRNLD